MEYKAELEAVELKSFARFVNRHWRTERLEARQASGGDDFGMGWQLWSYGDAIGQLTAQHLRIDRLRVRLILDDDDDETLPFDEPDDPEPWHERLRIDWILNFARGWLKYHYGANLVQDNDTQTPQANAEPAPGEPRGPNAGTPEKVREAHRRLTAGEPWKTVKKVCTYETYIRWCRTFTGEDPRTK